jgi:pimeloyl-ACP methyl ester carboxylesterase
MPKPDRVILVHGAWHGAWCWRQVLEALGAAGVDAAAIDLPGHGDDPGPAVDLHADARRVRDVLDAGDGPVVLVGHSYGGAVVTEAGDHPRVRHLVYIAAFNLDENESASTAAAGDPRAAALDHTGRPQLAATLVRCAPGVAAIAPEAAADLFYNDCSATVAAEATAKLGPQRLANLTETPAAIAWRTRPSTYVVCEDDNTVHPGLQRLLAERAETTLAWPTGHSPFLSRPDLVAGLLADLATAAD